MLRRALVLLLVLAFFILPCSAETDIDSEFKDMMNAVPDDLAGLLPEAFFDGINGAAEGLGEIGEMSFWRQLLGNIFSDSFKEIFPTLLSLFSLLLVSALLTVFKDVLRSNALSGAVGLAVSAVMISIFVRLASEHVELAFGCIEKLSQIYFTYIDSLGKHRNRHIGIAIIFVHIALHGGKLRLYAFINIGTFSRMLKHIIYSVKNGHAFGILVF